MSPSPAYCSSCDEFQYFELGRCETCGGDPPHGHPVTPHCAGCGRERRARNGMPLGTSEPCQVCGSYLVLGRAA